MALTASSVTLPADGEVFGTQTAADSKKYQGVYLVRSDTGDPYTLEANGQKVYLGVAIPAGDNNIGNVDIVTVPADPFGANADAATSGAGSINAHLRFIAATGIPVTALPALPAGTNLVGKATISDGTLDLELVDLTTRPAVPVAFVDTSGDQYSLATAVPLTITPTVSTSAYVSGDVLFAATALPGAAVASGKTGHLLRLTAIDKDDQGIAFDVYVYAANVTVPAANAPYTTSGPSDTDGAYFIEKLSFSTWEDHGGFRTCTLGVGDGLPLAYWCSGSTNLYIVGVTRGAPTHTLGGLVFTAHLQPEA